MAAALKAQGNTHFAKEQWQHALDCYSRALELERDPIPTPAPFSRTAARATSTSSSSTKHKPMRTSVSRNARRGRKDAQAIPVAEDEATKQRYIKALEAVGQIVTASRPAFPGSTPLSVESPVTDLRLQWAWDQSWYIRLQKAIAGGYKMGPGFRFLAFAYYRGVVGWDALEKAMRWSPGLNSKREIQGSPGSDAAQDLSECIMLDPAAFMIPPARMGKDPTFTLHRKFYELPMFDYHGRNVLRYFDGRRWTAKEIVAELDGMRKREGWLIPRKTLSTLTRATCLIAHRLGQAGKYGEAIGEMEFAISIFTEGNRVWPDVPYEEKGSSFRPRLIRLFQVELLRYRVEGNCLASSEHAEVAFSLESIVADANRIIAENPESRWSKDPKEADTNVAYQRIPNSRAYAALGFASAVNACYDLRPEHIPSGGIAVANLKQAREGAMFYDKAYELLPDDYYMKASVGFKALDQHLRAGGLKVGEIFRREEEIEKLHKEALRFFPGLLETQMARQFVKGLINCLRETMASPFIDSRRYKLQIAKAMPTCNLEGTPPGYGSERVATRAFWAKLPGEVGIVHEIYATEEQL